jgi:hypothetical protein
MLAGSTAVNTPQGVRYRTASGAIAESATDPFQAGGVVLAIRMNGTLAQLNGALAALQFLPAPGFEDFGVNSPALNVLANDGSAGASNATASIALRVEGVNGGPTVAGPAAPVSAPAGTIRRYPPDPGPGDPQPQLVAAIDPELCRNDPQNICGGAYPSGNPPPESDDRVLLVAWLPDPSCGRFAVRSASGFFPLGGPALPTVRALLTAPSGPAFQPGAADAILATLGPASSVDLAPQVAGPTRVFAGLASLENVRFALSQLEYQAPLDNIACTLRIAVSDLGNNGMPLAWVPANPTPVPPVPAHEIPDARADATSLVFSVTGAVVPDIAVTGNGVDIADGSVAASPADHTAFGAVLVAGGVLTRTFTIRNAGNAPLNLALPIAISGAQAGDFVVTAPPTASIAPAASTTFAVAFDPGAAGLRRARIEIASNDPGENPFDFAIEGVGIPDPVFGDGFEDPPPGVVVDGRLPPR